MNHNKVFVTEAAVYLDIDGEEEYKAQNATLHGEEEYKAQNATLHGEGEHAVCTWSSADPSSGASHLHNGLAEQRVLAASNEGNTGKYRSLFGILHPVLADTEVSPNFMDRSASALPAARTQSKHASKRKSTPFQEPNPYLAHSSTADDKNCSDEEIDVDTPYHGTLSGQTVSNEVRNPILVPLAEQFKRLQQIAKKSTTLQNKNPPKFQQTAKKSTTQRSKSMNTMQSPVCRAKLAKRKTRPKQDLLKIKMVYQKTTEPRTKSLGAVSSVQSSLGVELSTSPTSPVVGSDLGDQDKSKDMEVAADDLSHDEDNLILDVGCPDDEKYDLASISSPKTVSSLPNSLSCVSSSKAAEKEKLKPLPAAQSEAPVDKTFSPSLETSLRIRKKAVITPKIAVRKPVTSKETQRHDQLISHKTSPAAASPAQRQKRLPSPAEGQRGGSSGKSPVWVSKRTPESGNTGKPIPSDKGKVLSHSSNTAEEHTTTKGNAQQQHKPVPKKMHFQEPSGKTSLSVVACEEEHSEEACSRLLARPSSAVSASCSEMELRVSLVSLETAARPFDCSTCMEAFQEALTCPGAFRRLSRDKPFKCLLCSASFVHADHLKKHENVHATSGTRPACLTNAPLVSGIAYNDVVLKISGSSLSKIMGSNVSAHLSPQVRVIRLQEESAGFSEPRIKCKKCDKVFKNQSALDQHMIMHTVQGKIAKCQLCARTFLNKSGLYSHMRFIHGRLIVPPQTHDVRDVEENLESSESKGKLKCKKCCKSFKHKGALGRHMLAHSVLEKKPQLTNSLACRLCDKTFFSRHSLRCHMHFRHGHSLAPSELNMATEPFQCDICGQGFPSIAGLSNHKNRSHSALRTGPHKCGICSSRFSKLDTKIRHIRICHTEYVLKKEGNKNTNVFRCKSCSQLFAKWNVLWSHICSGQNKGSVLSENGETARRHLSQEVQHKQNGETDTSSADIKKSFQCDLCQKSYSYHRGLQRHIMMCHKKKLPSKTKLLAGQSADRSRLCKCILCLKEYSSYSSLRKHCHKFHKRLQLNLRQLRGGECVSLNLHCSKCQKDFKQQSSLVEHMEQHFRRVLKTCRKGGQTQQECFACEICKKRYRNKCTLNKHIRIRHPDASIFSCTKCGMGFLYSKALLAHIQTCQTQKDESSLYKCHRCDKSFSIAREWTKHMQMHYEGGDDAENSNDKSLCNSAVKDEPDEDRLLAASESQETQAKCDICSKYFKPGYLAVHLKRCHSKPFHHRCDKCGKGFFTAREWMAHAESHTNKMDEPNENGNGEMPPAEPLLVSKPSEHGTGVSDTSSGVGEVSCRFCKIPLKNRNILNPESICPSHSYRCECCGKNFHCVAELDQHTEFHCLATNHPSGQTRETRPGADPASWNLDEAQSQDDMAEVYAKDMTPLPGGQHWKNQHTTFPLQASEGFATQSQRPPVDLATLQEPRPLETAGPSEEEHFLNDTTDRRHHNTSSAMQVKTGLTFPNTSSPFGDSQTSAAEKQEVCEFHILGKPRTVGDAVEGKMPSGSDNMESSDERRFLQEIHELASLSLLDDVQLSGALPSTDDLQFLNLPGSEEFKESGNLNLPGDAEAVGLNEAGCQIMSMH